jgi:hypothetical protein
MGQMNIIDIARASGMAVILDGTIGREKYQSVCGSLSALQLFAEAVRQATVHQSESRIRRVRERPGAVPERGLSMRRRVFRAG